MARTVTRRTLLERSAAYGVVAAFGAAACVKKAATLSCTDTTGLSPTDLQIRATLAYTDISTEAGKICANCQQFVLPPSPGTCGTCKVVKGPINPAGNCKSFVAKPA